jgi:molybdenum cofactor cytidylyltransferase
MRGCADLAVILLAAGEGRRFGGAKLEAELDGKMLGLHAAELLAGMDFGEAIAVCNANQPSLNAELAQLGFKIIINPNPAAGQAKSLALGVCALGDANGALVALADMPYLTASHVQRLAATFDANNASTTICSLHGDVRMPPAIFPRSVWPMLTGITGDQGAKALLAEALTVAGTPHILRDIDRRDDLPG